MKKTKFALSFLAAFLFVITCATTGQSQAQRTFVAGPGIGLDTNNTVGQGYCSFTNPCRNFSVAYGVTNIGGEIIALTPGVGYGGLQIFHAITVTGLPGQVAFVAVAATTIGITASVGVSEQVTLRNITFNGSGGSNTTGFLVTSGQAVLEGCNFTQLTYGAKGTGGSFIAKNCSFTGNTEGVHVGANAHAVVLDSLIANNGTGVFADGNCNTVYVRLDGGSVINNTLGFSMNNAVCGPSIGSLTQNIFLHKDEANVFTVNVIGNTTAVGPSPGAGMNAFIGSYSNVVSTNY
ncbi:MAG: hypothetical protein QOI77_482 [Blastocatellia bacterium]|nr:hypothetical protein [Blastocatellia bacterium]